jgi:hypothetical protein
MRLSQKNRHDFLGGVYRIAKSVPKLKIRQLWVFLGLRWKVYCNAPILYGGYPTQPRALTWVPMIA